MRAISCVLRWGFLIGMLLVFVACDERESASERPQNEPYVLVLGTAQDGGLPQIGCDGKHCRLVRAHPERRRLVTSLLLVDPKRGQRWLFDATPDLPTQVERMRGHPASRKLSGPRPPLVEGIFLTHAHMGHYTGLVHLGVEAYGAKDVPVHCTPRMAEFLRNNGPWSQLVEKRNIRLEIFSPNVPVRLTPDLTVTAMQVPHRDEFSDTVAFRIDGPSRSLLYLPDIDKWERWTTAVESVIQQVDFALLDASFFDDGEIPGRPMAEIPHPFIVESLARFAPLPASQRDKIYFTHLNHTNPAGDSKSAAAKRVRDAGMHVAQDGDVYSLSAR